MLNISASTIQSMMSGFCSVMTQPYDLWPFLEHQSSAVCSTICLTRLSPVYLSCGQFFEMPLDTVWCNFTKWQNSIQNYCKVINSQLELVDINSFIFCSWLYCPHIMPSQCIARISSLLCWNAVSLNQGLLCLDYLDASCFQMGNTTEIVAWYARPLSDDSTIMPNDNVAVCVVSVWLK